MPETFDGYLYVDHLRARWRFVAATCATAVAITLGVSLILTKKYEATSRLVIEPPASSDPRAATAVTPVYLESLKTYEIFAASDNLFRQAVERFGLRDTGQPIDKLKKSVLKVAIPRNTKVLEITVRLGDPRKAQALAQHLAEEVVKLNRTTSRESDLEIAAETEQQLREARLRLEQAETAWAKQAAAQPVEELDRLVESLAALRTRVRQNLAAEELNTAGETDAEVLRLARARGERLRWQLQELDRNIASNQSRLAQRRASNDRLAAERKAAQAAVESSEKRLAEARGAVGSRTERLRIIDPGIVPERPAVPNIPLNMLVALAAALVVSLLYLTAEFGWRQGRPAAARPALRLAGKGGHD